MLNFSIFRFPVQVHWMFWLTMALLSEHLTRSSSPNSFIFLLIWIAAGFISILWHELGHAFMYRKYGYRSSISLIAFGGLTLPSAAARPKEQIPISLAGPGVQFLLFGAMYLALYLTGRGPGFSWYYVFPYANFALSTGSIYFDEFIRKMLIVNMIWPIINLIPMLPLDGGRVMQALLLNDRKTLKISVVVGFAVAVLALFLLKSIFMGLMFGYMAFTNLQQLQGIYGGFGPGPGPGSYRRR